MIASFFLVWEARIDLATSSFSHSLSCLLTTWKTVRDVPSVWALDNHMEDWVKLLALGLSLSQWWPFKSFINEPAGLSLSLPLSLFSKTVSKTEVCFSPSSSIAAGLLTNLLQKWQLRLLQTSLCQPTRVGSWHNWLTHPGDSCFDSNHHPVIQGTTTARHYDNLSPPVICLLYASSLSAFHANLPFYTPHRMAFMQK